MHSRSNSLENISEVKSSQLQAQVQQRESKCDEPSTSFRDPSRSCYKELPVNMSTVQPKHRNSGCSQTCNKNCELSGNSRDLSHDDLLLLLSILEGELQARDEVITVLRAEKTELASLEAHYGFMTPPKVLQALQRDNIQGIDYGWQEDIYEKPIAELDKLVEKQKETYRRMLENLLLVEQAHKQTLYRLENEKRNHSEYMKKCDEFTNLLEQERERLKLLNDQEKASQERREEENNRKVTNLTEELTKLKSFALLVIDEQQRVTEQLTLQTAKVQDLQVAAREAQEELNSAQTRAQKMESKVLHLESELHARVVQYHQEQEVMSKNLTEKNSLNQHLHQKLSKLCQELTELEQSNKALRRAEEELQELRDKNSNRENGTSSLVSEVEELRKRVVEMEEKGEEFIKMEDLCRNLKRNLERESIQNCSLKTEVDKLNLKITELEKLQDAFEKSKQECSSLKCNLEKERAVTKHMCNELDNLRLRIKELEAAEGLLEKTEWTLKEDLTKLKTLTVKLVDERTTMAEKLKQLEIKVQNSTDKLQVEQEKVTIVTEKLIEESKKALKFKVELEEKICIVTRERDDFETKLKTEEETNNALQSKVSVMEKRLQSMEAVEREFLRNKEKQENIKGPIQNGFQHEHNKVKDLTQNVKCLRWKLNEKNVVKGNFPMTHDAGESLEMRYPSEKALMEELEITRMELSRYQLLEKKNFNQEHSLYKQLKEEEVKSNHLTKEVEALKEKIHNYMSTEDSICHMKTEYATLQKKLTQQEVRNKELAREKESLTRELERYRRFSKSLRPGMIGKRFSDLHVTTKEVQTEPIDSPIHTYKNFSPLECAVMNGKIYEERNQQHEPTYKEINPAKCSPPLKNSNNHQNNTVQLRNAFLKSMEKQQLIDCKLQTAENRSHIQQADMLVTHNPSQHLHVKVTPDHSHSTATLKIKSPITENIQSYTSTAVIPTSGCTRKQKNTIVQNAPSSEQKYSSSIKSPSTPEPSMSPVSMTTYCQTVIPEFTGLLTPNIAVPLTEVKAGHNVFCVTPPRQNNQHVHGYNSSSPSVITNEENKIHIHLGIPYLKTINSNIEPCSPGYSAGQKQSTSVFTSDTPGKVNSKILGSIRINPTISPIPQPSQITIPVEEFHQSLPTKLPKPNADSTTTRTNSRAVLTQSKETGQAWPKLGKNM